MRVGLNGYSLIGGMKRNCNGRRAASLSSLVVVASLFDKRVLKSVLLKNGLVEK